MQSGRRRLTHSPALLLHHPFLGPAVLADIKRGLPSAVLLELEPGAGYRQTTHTMLLRGQLLAADAPEGEHEPERGATQAASAASAAAPEAPRILPWLWCSRYRCNQATAAGGGVGSGGLKLAADQMWQAGPEGALLLVCLTEAGEVPEGVLEAEDAAELAAMEAAAADAAAPASPLSPGAIKSHPLDLAQDSGGQQPAPSGSAAVAAAAAAAGTEEGSAARALERIASQPPPRASGLM